MAYLLDANVFIQAKNLHYGFDFCPAFWDWLIANNISKRVFSVEKVGDELKAGADELSRWAVGQGNDFFLQPDSRTLSSLSTISNWATTQGFEQTAVSTFFRAADFYLIAHAYANGDIIVTHERISDSNKKIKIPNVCIGLGVGCVTPYEMLRRERARFIVGSENGDAD